MFFTLKSIPIVVIKVGEKESLAYLNNKQVFPTPKNHDSISYTSLARYIPFSRVTYRYLQSSIV